MKERYKECYRCHHEAHALGVCGAWDTSKGRACQCAGSWDAGTLDLSGFCFSYSPEEAAHDECPGKGYTYPCECPCHGAPF